VIVKNQVALMLGRTRKTGKHRRNSDCAHTETHVHGRSIGAGGMRATLCAMHGNPGRIWPVDSFHLAPLAGAQASARDNCGGRA
jgi:hypothetical protein